MGVSLGVPGLLPLTPAATPLSMVVPWGQSTLSLHVNVQSGSAFYNYDYLLTAF